jgi:BlaI family penicillinase repressor
MNMEKNETPIPTESELAILNVLWTTGPSTVREVQNILNRTRKSGYTTVLKLLQIMTKKRLVRRDESNHAHVYVTNYSKQETQRRLLDDLLKKAFGGSSVQLASTLFDADRLSKSEFEKLRNKIIELRKKESDSSTMGLLSKMTKALMLTLMISACATTNQPIPGKYALDEQLEQVKEIKNFQMGQSRQPTFMILAPRGQDDSSDPFNQSDSEGPGEDLREMINEMNTVTLSESSHHWIKVDNQSLILRTGPREYHLLIGYTST